MNNPTNLLQKNRVYFAGLLLFLFSGILLSIVFTNTAAVISQDTYHPFWLNVFFINYTFIGDGIFALCIAGICIFYLKKKQEGAALLVGLVLSGTLVQLIKNLLGPGVPELFFEPGQYLFSFDHVSLANTAGFPSGHTATAFLITTVLILTGKAKNLQVPALLAAMLVGYSRIYLAQHTLIDVLSGALIGGLAGFSAVILVKKPWRITQTLKKMHRIKRGPLVNSPDIIQPI